MKEENVLKFCCIFLHISFVLLCNICKRILTDDSWIILKSTNKFCFYVPKINNRVKNPLKG